MGYARLELQRPAERFAQTCTGIDCDGTDWDAADMAVSLRRDLIEATVAHVFGVHAPELHRLSRGKAEVAQARQVAMYLTHTVFGLSLSDTGRIFERDRTTVAHACSVIEDMRDDSVFDRVIELLEGVIPALVLPRAAVTGAH
jgi:hypothetical protein